MTGSDRWDWWLLVVLTMTGSSRTGLTAGKSMTVVTGVTDHED